jgi:hypothetical protein
MALRWAAGALLEGVRFGGRQRTFLVKAGHWFKGFASQVIQKIQMSGMARRTSATEANTSNAVWMMTTLTASLTRRWPGRVRVSFGRACVGSPRPSW